jgi:hypothetical protein
VPAAERKALDLGDGVLALRIQEIAPTWLKGRNAAAADLRLRKGDVLITIDGDRGPRREDEFLAYLLQAKSPGEKVRLTVLRAGRAREVELPIP